MKRVKQEQPVRFEVSTNGGTDFNSGDSIDVGAISKGSTSNTVNVRINFTNSDFDKDDELDGFYNGRFWVENLPVDAEVNWEYQLSDDASAAFSSAGAMPQTHIETGLMNKSLLDSSDNNFEFLRFKITTSSSAKDYDTAKTNKFDPLLCVEWERENSGAYLSADFPNPQSDHLWIFSQADIYVNLPNASGVASSQVGNRWLIGWCADEDIGINMQQNMVNFTKGKPSGNVVSFMSELDGSVSLTNATFDPWFLEKALHITATVENGNIVFSEKNTQRPIEDYFWSVEWKTNSGHRVAYEVPKGQLFYTSEMTPGGGEIQKAGYEIRPLVTSKRTLYELKVSQSTVQTICCPITYSIS